MFIGRETDPPEKKLPRSAYSVLTDGRWRSPGNDVHERVECKKKKSTKCLPNFEGAIKQQQQQQSRALGSLVVLYICNIDQLERIQEFLYYINTI